MKGMLVVSMKKPSQDNDDAFIVTDSDTLECIYQLALLYKTNQLNDQAEELYYECLNGRRKIYGLEHIDTLKNLSDLSEVLELKDEYEKAEPLYQELINSQIFFLGIHHPFTIRSIASLSRMYAQSGDAIKEGVFMLKIQRYHSIPYTLYPIPYIPYTLYPIYPIPYTLYPIPYTLIPYTLYPL